VKPRPGLDELKPKVIDGSTQTEMHTDAKETLTDSKETHTDAKETQTTEAETAVPIANVSIIPPARPPPPVTHLAPCSCYSPNPAPTQNVTASTAGKALPS